MSLAISGKFAKQFRAFHCSTRCVRCACFVPQCATVSGNHGVLLFGGYCLPYRSMREQSKTGRFSFQGHNDKSTSRREPHPRQGVGKGARARPGTGGCRFRQPRAATTRCREGVRAGPTDKNAAPAGAPLQAVRDRARHKSRSAFRPNSSTGDHENRAGTVTGSCPRLVVRIRRACPDRGRCGR